MGLLIFPYNVDYGVQMIWPLIQIKQYKTLWLILSGSSQHFFRADLIKDIQNHMMSKSLSMKWFLKCDSLIFIMDSFFGGTSALLFF